MAKRKKIELENIPLVLEKIVSVMDREVDTLANRSSLSDAESRNLIAYSQALTAIYKDYRQEVLAIEKDLKSKTKEEIMAIVKTEVK